jgi:hypothetical protein
MRQYGPWILTGIFPMGIILPCLWFAAPCLYFSFKGVQLELDNLFYVVTDAGPYVYRRDTPDVCCGSCFSSGNDSAKIAWVRFLN